MMPWYAGAIIVWAAAAIVAAYVRRLGLRTRGVILGLAVAVVVGAVAGWQMPGDEVLAGSPWLGGIAGLTGACSPFVYSLAKAAATRLAGKMGPK
jgi:hypothetical protein